MTADSSPVPPAPGKREDSAAGCRSMADDDRARAEASDSDRMRVRLASSADVWTVRAELLDRLEANRARIKTEGNIGEPNPGPPQEKNDD